jgi:hypothetical protein
MFEIFHNKNVKPELYLNEIIYIHIYIYILIEAFYLCACITSLEKGFQEFPSYVVFIFFLHGP